MFSIYGEGFGCTDPIKAPVPQECVCPRAQWGGLAGAARGGGAWPLGTRRCARGSSWHPASGASRSALLQCRPGPGGQLFVIFSLHIKSELRPKARVPC